MATNAPRMPTVPETIRTYSGISELGDRSNWRRLIVGGALLVGVILLLPAIEWLTGSNPPWLVAILIAPALGSAHLEYRFGGTPRLILVAGLTSMVTSSISLLAFVALWSVIGGRLAFLNPIGLFFRLPMELQVGSLIGLMLLLIVGYFVRKPSRERAAAAFEARVRAERTRRGLPTDRTEESFV